MDKEIERRWDTTSYSFPPLLGVHRNPKAVLEVFLVVMCSGVDRRLS
jgi:hypothetical protein